MEEIFETVRQLMEGFQQGQLPDLGTWNYMLVGVSMMFQGRITALFGGIAAAAGYFPLIPILLVALGARLIVDLFWYNVGSRGQIDRFGRRFERIGRMTEQVQDQMRDKPRRYVFLAKLSNGLSLPAVITAGSAGIPYRRWLPASFAGELLWTVPLLLLGYFATDAIGQVEGGLSYMTFASVAIFILGFIVMFVKSRRTAPTE
jgi:undecaprenyl-diphosphatase